VDSSEKTNPIPQYRSHKIVGTDSTTDENPIVFIGFGGKWEPVKMSLRGKPTPDVGWYFVMYPDGYTSFSPAKSFEEGYTLIPASFKDRVVAEKAELDEKIGKLQTFATGPIFDKLPPEEKGRMHNQFSVMQDYSKILGERIAAF